MSVSLSITNQACMGVNQVWLGVQLRKVLRMLGIREGEWTITAVNDPAMIALHERTMGLGTTTDVLTFDLREGAARRRKSVVELDTVICRDEASRRARELGHPLREELLLYCVHSLLHVQGYDDVTERGAAAMHRREDEILLRLGVGRVYAGGEKKKAAGRRGSRKKPS